MHLNFLSFKRFGGYTNGKVNIEDTSHETNSPTFLMEIYYQLISVETSREESLHIPIQGRHLSLLALLFLFLPEAHPLADCCSSPQPDRPTGQLHQESPLQKQKDAELLEEENVPTHTVFLWIPLGALESIQISRCLVCLLRCLRQNGIYPASSSQATPKSLGENRALQVRNAP